MFPFRPSRAATALLELAEAMLAPDAFESAPADAGAEGEPSADQHHPHRRAPELDLRRRPAPRRPEQACVTPLTRAGRARTAQRVASPRG